MYSFAGGLGDVILQLFKISQYDQIIENAKQGKRIIINLSCSNPFAGELFNNMPNKKNLKINILDYYLFCKLDPEERQTFLKEINSEQIDFKSKYGPEAREKNGYVDFFLLDGEEEIINEIVNRVQRENKKLIIFSPCTGSVNRTPTKVYCNQVITNINNNFILAKIGRDYSTEYGGGRYDKEYTFKHEKVIDLTNKLSVPATLELVKRSDGIITSDTSMVCYGDILDKPMFIMISDKNKDQYLNYKKNPYYQCFDKEYVIVRDWQNTDQESINKFLKLL